MNKPKVYVFTDYYLPGYKAGGVLRALASLVQELNSNFEFFIVTRDRDCGDKKPYSNVRVDEWVADSSGAHVYYISARWTAIPLVFKLMKAGAKDIIYLTSFFSPYFTILPLLFVRLGFLKVNCVILAPRGELSPGCLDIKKNKKNIFLKFAINLGLYKKLIWHASSVNEKNQIEATLGKVAATILEAPDILCKTEVTKLSVCKKKSGSLDLIFLSRISRVKNLAYLLDVLKKCKKIIRLDIYGPLEDMTYWAKCQHLIDTMPTNIYVRYVGPVDSNKVVSTFAKYDLFAFPTLGESFGNVILESLMAGTPVLLSDKTPWVGTKLGGIKVLDLQEQSWVKALDSLADMDEGEYGRRSIDALEYVKKYKDESMAIEKNLFLFSSCLKRFKD